MDKLSRVNTHQAVILDELKTIEDELDRMLPQVGAQEADFNVSDGLRKHVYLTTFLRDPDLYNSTANREKVFGQALELEKDIHDLKNELGDVTREMTDAEKAHAKASDLYLYKSD